MGYWIGTVYASGTITGDSNSGFLNMAQVMGLARSSSAPSGAADSVTIAIKKVVMRMVPADLATDETLDLDWNVAWDAGGTADVKVHDFTQVTSTNAAETLLAPGGESVTGILSVDAGTNDTMPGLIPPFWKFGWTLGGSAKSMQFTVTAIVEY